MPLVDPPHDKVHFVQHFEPLQTALKKLPMHCISDEILQRLDAFPDRQICNKLRIVSRRDQATDVKLSEVAIINHLAKSEHREDSQDSHQHN